MAILLQKNTQTDPHNFIANTTAYILAHIHLSMQTLPHAHIHTQ